MSQVDTTWNKVVLLDENCSVSDFDCGEPARNAWLRTRALQNQRSGDTRTYVALRGDEVVGFHALTVGSIVRGVLPGPSRRNAVDPVSCVLLAQLAVALHAQREGVGRELVLHAMEQAARIAEIAGCRLFAVHPARPDLVGYYERFELVSVATIPALMAMPLQKVRHILSAVASAG
jgi:predicted N-acetyltransferase YhbS